MAIINIAPSPKAMRTMTKTGKPAFYSLAELIDNSIDAALPNTPVDIHINYNITKSTKKIKQITIQDNASGMKADTLALAMTIGKSTKDFNGKTIGKYGIGLKTAVQSLGELFSIKTTTKESFFVNEISMNFNEFDEQSEWECELHSNKPKKFDHGTLITISGCNELNSALFAKDLLENISEHFSSFIEAGMANIYVNGVVVKPHAVSLIKDSKLTLEHRINEKIVTGWIGLKVSTNGDYGLNLLRNGRTVMSNQKIGFEADPIYNRLVGVINLDDFTTDHHKTTFVQTNDDWADLVKVITKDIQPVLELARKLSEQGKKRVPKTVKGLVDNLLSALADKMRLDPELMALLGENPFVNNLKHDNTLVIFEARNGEAKAKTRSDEPKRDHKPRTPKGVKFESHEVSSGAQSFRKHYTVDNGVLMVYTNVDFPGFPTPDRQVPYIATNIVESIAHYYVSQDSIGDSIDYKRYERILDRMQRAGIEIGIST